jgi:ABC-type sugar transport system ATPase subunit
MSHPGVNIRNLTKAYGPNVILDNIDVDIDCGEFIVLLGPSGCGKSTLLRLIAGLEENHTGEIHISGENVTLHDPKDRKVAMVFQSYALYPHLDVFENIAFGMRIRKEPKAEIERKVAEAARILKLEPLLERLPSQLSGGQRQRVAIGRAMVRSPHVFLFDEPLSNLDAQLRAEMRAEIKRLHQRLGSTIIYVTHDQIEAMTLADRIALLNKGKIEQLGTPAELYENPVSLFAARFIGSPEINCLDGVFARTGQGPAVLVHGLVLPLDDTSARTFPDDGAPVTVAVRPEKLQLVEPDGHPDTLANLPLDLAEPTGSETFLVLDVAGQPLRLKVPGMLDPKPGQPMAVRWDRRAAKLFDPTTGARL